VDVYLARLRSILLISAISLSSSTATQPLGSHIHPQSDNNGDRNGFKRIPAELRNQIYEDFIPTCAEHRFIKLDKLDQAACKNPWELALALGLKPFFPLLFASKQILDEALPFCLQTCDLYVRNLSHLEALEEVQYLPTFRKIANHIRALTLDLTPKEKPAPPRIIPASWDDLPPLRTHVEGACKQSSQHSSKN
jgi:hypothetical protein